MGLHYTKFNWTHNSITWSIPALCSLQTTEDVMTVLQLIGWLGATLFALCALPQVIHVWRTKRTEDLSWGFLLMWFFGEVFTFGYVYMIGEVNGYHQWPLIANYSLNFIFLCYILYMKFINELKKRLI